MSYGREPHRPRCPECGSDRCFQHGPGGVDWKCYGCNPYGRHFRTDRAGGSSREEKSRALDVAARAGLVHPGTRPEDEG